MWRVKFFSWKFYFENKTIKSEHAVENCFSPNEKSYNMSRLPSLMMSTFKCGTPQAILSKSQEEQVQRKF